MRILCVAEDFPWPEHSGYRLRLVNVIRALSELGDLDCFFVVNDGIERPPCVVPEGAGVARVHVVDEGPPTSTRSRILRWATTRLPRGLLWRRWAQAPAELRAFRAWPPYDLVWFSHIDVYLELGDLVDGPKIVDLDTLEDFRLRYSLETARDAADEWHQEHQERSSLRRAVRAQTARIDIGRWDRIQHRVARAVDAVVLCSELDRKRFGEPNCVVVPNGYELPGPVPEARPVEQPVEQPVAQPVEPAAGVPVMTMVGALGYEPNYDGAWWFARRVLLLVRAQHPDATFFLVGRVADEVAALQDEPGVVLRGRVDDISAELGHALLEVVPLRSGGGTRVKILEAFAHRVPVVTTTIGCEGLDVEDGVHVLIADDPAAFAAACLRVIDDAALRAALTEAAFGVYAERFQGSVLRAAVTRAAADVAGRSRGAGPPDGTTDGRK